MPSPRLTPRRTCPFLAGRSEQNATMSTGSGPRRAGPVAGRIDGGHAHCLSAARGMSTGGNAPTDKPGSSQRVVGVASGSGPDICWPHDAPALPCMADSLAAGAGAGRGVREGLHGNRVGQLRHCGRGWGHAQRLMGAVVHPGLMFPNDGEPCTEDRPPIRDRNSHRGQRSWFSAGWWSHRGSHHGRENRPGQLAFWVRHALPRVRDRPGFGRNRKDPCRE